MISFDYASRHLRGVWRLAAGDENWREELDITTDGVFASLWAIALSAPFAILSGVTEINIARSAPGYASSIYAKLPLSIFLSTELLSALLTWGVTLAALGYAARRLGATRDAAALIISYNWSQLLTYIATIAPAFVMVATGSDQIGALLFFAIFIFSLYLFWVVLRRNLPVDIGVALGLIAGLTAVAIGVYAILNLAAVRLYQLFSHSVVSETVL